jgi:hypothetical protein
MGLYFVNPLRAVAARFAQSVDLWLGYFGNHKRDTQQVLTEMWGQFSRFLAKSVA